MRIRSNQRDACDAVSCWTWRKLTVPLPICSRDLMISTHLVEGVLLLLLPYVISSQKIKHWHLEIFIVNTGIPYKVDHHISKLSRFCVIAKPGAGIHLCQSSLLYCGGNSIIPTSISDSLLCLQEAVHIAYINMDFSEPWQCLTVTFEVSKRRMEPNRNYTWIELIPLRWKIPLKDLLWTTDCSG